MLKECNLPYVIINHHCQATQHRENTSRFSYTSNYILISRLQLQIYVLQCFQMYKDLLLNIALIRWLLPNRPAHFFQQDYPCTWSCLSGKSRAWILCGLLWYYYHLAQIDLLLRDVVIRHISFLSCDKVMALKVCFNFLFDAQDKCIFVMASTIMVLLYFITCWGCLRHDGCGGWM